MFVTSFRIIQKMLSFWQWHSHPDFRLISFSKRKTRLWKYMERGIFLNCSRSTGILSLISKSWGNSCNSLSSIWTWDKRIYRTNKTTTTKQTSTLFPTRNTPSPRQQQQQQQQYRMSTQKCQLLFSLETNEPAPKNRRNGQTTTSFNGKTNTNSCPHQMEVGNHQNNDISNVNTKMPNSCCH